MRKDTAKQKAEQHASKPYEAQEKGPQHPEVRLSSSQRMVQEETGQTLILAALTMVVLVGVLGLSVDAGVLRYQKRQLQNLADASAMAAALEISACGGTANCSMMQTAAKTALVENGFTASLLTNCAARAGNKLEISVNDPPCAVAGDGNAGNTYYVETVVSEPVPTVFARVLGVNSVNVLARAEAVDFPPPCIYFLSQYSSGSSLSASGGGFGNNCPYYLGRSYSMNGADMTHNQSPFFVAGRSSSSTGTVTPTPTFNVPKMADPLANLAAPTYGACDHTGNYSVTQAATLQPGVYCGGLTINTSATITFSPGTYVILGALSINGPVSPGVTLQGAGVTFYLTQNSSYPYAASSIQNVTGTLSAPTSGRLQGIFYFSDRSLPTGNAGLSVTNWNPALRLDGIFYLPGQQLTVANATLWGSYYFGVVADSCSMTGGYLNPSNNFVNLANGSPYAANARAAIVQ